ncbi:MAG: Gp15 family bacteriophage protein [Lachnospiraceae bacterium]
MFNILLDPPPEEWHGYPLDTDFRIGIQISQCLTDESLNKREKILTAIHLLFPSSIPEMKDAMEALEWYLSEYDHDNHEKKSGKVKLLDFDVDQWRIYAAFMRQYRIDLNTVEMHWFTFMGLISNLEECNFTRVIDIRQRDIPVKASAEEKKRIRKAKRIYSLAIGEERINTEQEEQNQEALDEFLSILSKK